MYNPYQAIRFTRRMDDDVYNPNHDQVPPPRTAQAPPPPISHAPVPTDHNWRKRRHGLSLTKKYLANRIVT